MTTFFTEFKDALVNYPDTGVTITIEDQSQHTGSGSAVNVNEIWEFRVKVRNRGWLDMQNISVTVDGDNGCTVSESPDGPWRNMIDVSVPDAISGHSKKTDYLYMKASSTEQPAGTQLVESHLAEWDAGLDTLMTKYAGESQAEKGKWTDSVEGD